MRTQYLAQIAIQNLISLFNTEKIMVTLTYENLVNNPPKKIKTDHKLAYLLPYFKREKTPEEISAETGVSLGMLTSWLKDDFSNLAEYIDLLDEIIESELEDRCCNECLQQDIAMLENEISDLYLKNLRMKKAVTQALSLNKDSAPQIIADDFSDAGDDKSIKFVKGDL